MHFVSYKHYCCTHCPRILSSISFLQLLAMESIYGENVFILDKQRDLRSFQVLQ